jgi:pilus assembly protein CpaB
MNRRLAAILILAFVIAGACAYLVYRVVGTRLNAAKPLPATRAVAAATDIKLGTVLTAANLTTIDIAGVPPKGVILDPKNAIGRGVISDLYMGEPIIESRLAAPGSGGGLAATIPPGMRACAVRVDDVVGVAGFVTPGMHVDIIIAGTPPGQQSPTEGIVVKTILQNIAVLSAGQDIQKDAEGKPKPVPVVNVLVTPEQAQILSLASSNGQTRIQMVLRNPLDNDIAKVPENAMGNIFADTAPKPKAVAAKPAPKPAPKFSIEIINGAKVSQEQFATPEGKK